MAETLNTRWNSTGSRLYYKPHVFVFSFWPRSSIKPASSQNLRHYLQLLLSGQTVVMCNIHVPGDNKGLCLRIFLVIELFWSKKWTFTIMRNTKGLFLMFMLYVWVLIHKIKESAVLLIGKPSLMKPSYFNALTLWILKAAWSFERHVFVFLSARTTS